MLRTFGLLRKNNISFISPLPCLRHFSNEITMENTVTDLISIFNASVASVLPQTLIAENVEVKNKNVIVCGKSYTIPEDGCHIIGFGKAVLGMAVELEKMLSSHVAGGIINVPVGIFEKFKAQPFLLPKDDTRLKFLEGAEGNLPDEIVMKNTKETIAYVENSKENSLIFVLISGGGSALFSLPKPPITMEEKQELIKELALSGADITELNTVRKQLSIVKGGGLARIARPRQLICLILSDVIGDPLDLIASGPTTVNNDDISCACVILEKYNMKKKISESIRKVLFTSELPKINNCEFSHVDNYLIGNNKKAVVAARDEAEKLNYSTCCLSTEVKGDVSILGSIYSNMAIDISNCYENQASIDTFKHAIEEAKEYFKISDSAIEEIYRKIQEYRCLKTNGICIINGGEPTVFVRGDGLGGRNQQLALEFSRNMETLPCFLQSYFLSCGTDGIDGPTDAAGAIGFSNLVELAADENLNVHSFICKNNSYGFYSSFNEGKFLLKPGHTGTNVMDIQVLIIH